MEIYTENASEPLTTEENLIDLKNKFDESKRTHSPFFSYRYPGGKIVLGSFDPTSLMTMEFAPFEGDSIVIENIKPLHQGLWNEYTPLQAVNVIESLHDLENPKNATREDFVNIVTRAKEKIKSGLVEKVVLSKCKKINQNIHPIRAFLNLEKKFTNAFVYCFYHPISGIWVGASPEKLLEKTIKDHYHIHSLAGTKNMEQDWTAKEVIEQQIVTDYILDQIKSVGAEHIDIEGPFDLAYGSIKHLKTRIDFRSEKNTKAILNAIHPTPAVCGMPKERAKNLISELESYDRSYYTGFIGIKEPDEGLEAYFVNLRCIQWTSDNCYIYTGAGIVDRSVPEEEWREVEAKANTLQDCIVIND